MGLAFKNCTVEDRMRFYEQPIEECHKIKAWCFLASVQWPFLIVRCCMVCLSWRPHSGSHLSSVPQQEPSIKHVINGCLPRSPSLESVWAVLQSRLICNFNQIIPVFGILVMKDYIAN